MQELSLVGHEPEMVEVVDAADRTLCVLPLTEAHRQSLNHRSVRVLVYDSAGKLYLQKRSRTKSLYPSRWDLSATGHVQAGESRLEAARRELYEELGIEAERLVKRHALPASAETAHEFATLYSAGVTRQPPQPNPEEVETGMFADRDEIAYLVEHYRETLTPGLVYYWEKGLLFKSL